MIRGERARALAAVPAEREARPWVKSSGKMPATAGRLAAREARPKKGAENAKVERGGPVEASGTQGTRGTPALRVGRPGVTRVRGLARFLDSRREKN